VISPRFTLTDDDWNGKRGDIGIKGHGLRLGIPDTDETRNYIQLLIQMYRDILPPKKETLEQVAARIADMDAPALRYEIMKILEKREVGLGYNFDLYTFINQLDDLKRYHMGKGFKARGGKDIKFVWAVVHVADPDVKEKTVRWGLQETVEHIVPDWREGMERSQQVEGIEWEGNNGKPTIAEGIIKGIKAGEGRLALMKYLMNATFSARLARIEGYLSAKKTSEGEPG
jgi:hypothetical protein